MNTDLLKLTPWYPVSVKPVRDGVYRVRGNEFGGKPKYAFWDKGQWYAVSGGPVGATEQAFRRTSVWMEYISSEWCGLVEQPK